MLFVTRITSWVRSDSALQHPLFFVFRQHQMLQCNFLGTALKLRLKVGRREQSPCLHPACEKQVCRSKILPSDLRFLEVLSVESPEGPGKEGGAWQLIVMDEVSSAQTPPAHICTYLSFCIEIMVYRGVSEAQFPFESPFSTAITDPVGV